MNCPKCGKELIEQEEGVLLCEGCGAMYRRKKKAETPPADVAMAPTQVAPETKDLPGAESATPSSGAAAEENASPQEKGTAALKTEEQLRIELLERRLAEMEARQNEGKTGAAVPLREKVKSFFAALPAFARSHKKGVAFCVFLLLGVILTIVLCVSLCGVRGVYVNAEDPNNYYIFKANSYTCVWKNEFGKQEEEKGSWSTSGGKITFTIKDEDFGKLSESFDFKKKSDNDMIVIDGKEYSRVARSLNSKITLTFTTDEESFERKIKIGSAMKDVDLTGYVISSVKNESGAYVKKTDLQWTAASFTVEKCTHPYVRCTDAKCSACNMEVSDIADTLLQHNKDTGYCLCSDCNKTIHQITYDMTCSWCGYDQIYTRDGDYVLFGFYPQTEKKDSVTITETVDSRGYYLGSDGEYYAKKSSGWFDAYYFKVEPIKWRVLETQTDDYTGQERILLLSEKILYCTKGFANVSGSIDGFSISQNERVLRVNNSRFFLLSKSDATHPLYGFSETEGRDETRAKKPTNFAFRASSDYRGQHTEVWSWLLKSGRVSGDGFILNGRSSEDVYGVAPAVWMILP